jgi:acetoacetate decarboxylase
MSKDLRAGGLDRLTVADILAPGFSTPWDAPTVPPFPFTFRNVEVLTLAWRTTPAAVARLLPPPLEPVGDVVLAHVYRMRDVDWLGPYGESNVSIGCRLPGTDVAGSYSPYLFLSSDVGVVHGREVHGQPKKSGNPTLDIRGDLVVGRVERNGIDVLTGTLATKQRRDTLDSLKRHFDFAENINLKAIDHIDGRPAIRQLTARRLAEVVVHECWGGPCTVELRPNAQAPIHRLPVVDMLDGVHWRADFTLVPGRIVHDYLAG